MCQLFASLLSKHTCCQAAMHEINKPNKAVVCWWFDVDRNCMMIGMEGVERAGLVDG